MKPSLRVHLGAAGVGVLVALSLASCRQILDIQDREVASRADAGGVGVDLAAVCAECRDSSCGDAVAACEGDRECKQTAECLRRCQLGDADCAAWCLGSIARPALLADLTSCSSQRCDDACGGERCGELFVGSSACDACVRKHCCAENAACSANAACADLDFCDKRCLPAGSPKCTEGCKEQHSEGGDDWAARNACVTSECAAECVRGTGWACLDDRRPYELPSRSGGITFQMTVADFVTDAPHVGITVKACNRRDVRCDDPLDTQTTDDTGLVEITVPSGSVGFDGYLDFSGGDLYPALYYFAPPLVAGGPRGHLQLPTTTELTGLIGFLELTPDPSAGHLALVAWDCTLAPAPGVSFSLKQDIPSAEPYYFAQQGPTLDATQTGGDPAIGGFVNVPGDRLVTVRAAVAATGQVSSEGSFYVRPGTLTTGPMPPTPTL